LAELARHGLLKPDESAQAFDFHPLVRQYAYSRLKDPAAIHTLLAGYFQNSAATADEAEVNSSADLAPVVELLYHTVKAGQFDRAYRLFYDRLYEPLYTRFGAYQTCIEVLRRFFPDGEELDPPLSDTSAQLRVINDLARLYSCVGQSRRAVRLFTDTPSRIERDDTALDIIAGNQVALGELHTAEDNYATRLRLLDAPTGELAAQATMVTIGCLEAILGRYDQSQQHLEHVIAWCAAHDRPKLECVAHIYQSFRALLIQDFKAALAAARKAQRLATGERNAVRSQWVLGSALLGGPDQDLDEAQERLTDGLIRCRKVNLVDFEADILVAVSRLHHRRNNLEAAGHAADQALSIATHCEYRLTQADAHLTLADIASQAGDSPMAIAHARLSRDLAWCQGPSHSYASVLARANALLKLLVAPAG